MAEYATGTGGAVTSVGSSSYSTLELRPTIRRGGNSKTEREFLDFIVGGESLWRYAGDTMSVLVWFQQEYDREPVMRLLLKAEPDLPDGRQTLYICPECGDLGCGALTVIVERTPDAMVWRDFGWQRDYEGSLELIEGLGPFRFQKQDYFQVITLATNVSP